jgi:tRNA threonylcarbamoyladenosine biosynthesis protein TsaB
MSPIILHLETATEVCSISVSKGTTLLALEESKEGNIHSARITLMIKAVVEAAGLNYSELNAVSLSQGPGSYTSLRVGTSAAKAICYAWDIPLIAIDTLASLAMAAVAKGRLKEKSTYSIPLIDARRMEVYTAVFDQHNKVVEGTHAKIMEADAFQYLVTADNYLLFSGNGVEKCKEILTHPRMIFSDIVCSATHLIEPALLAYYSGSFADTAYFSPYYFKSPSVTTSKKKIL